MTFDKVFALLMSRVRNDFTARTIVRAFFLSRAVTSRYYVLLSRYPVTPSPRIFPADLLLAKMVDRPSPTPLWTTSPKIKLIEFWREAPAENISSPRRLCEFFDRKCD